MDLKAALMATPPHSGASTGPMSDFISAYNFGRRLKTLKGLTPYKFSYKRWATEPERFSLDPLHQMPGLDIS